MSAVADPLSDPPPFTGEGDREAVVGAPPASAFFDPRGWWVMKPCRYWDARRNARFRLIRIDGSSNYCGELPAMLWDGDRRELIRPANTIKFGDLARRARKGDLQGSLPLELRGND